MGTIHWLRADGTQESEESEQMPQRDRLMHFVDGHIEFVWVAYNGKRTCMIVNETGAMKTDERGPLAVNEAASKIYMQTNARPDDYPHYAPRIYGNAVVLENIFVG